MNKPITIGDLWNDVQREVKTLSSSMEAVRASRARVEAALADGKSYYSINTGFGVLVDTKISEENLTELQRNLLLSHAVGVGAPVPKEITKLMLGLKIHALGLGFSGITPETLQRLILFFERDLIPYVPEKGSVGASGDLAPLAHLALPLIGKGDFWDESGENRVRADKVLAERSIAPIELKPKDGLALINGTQFMSAYGAFVLHRAISLLKTADLFSAMSLEALRGSVKPCDSRVQAVRPHPGQEETARNVRMLLENSEILESHRNCGKIQDPYCLRCVPQVHGAARGALAHCRSVVQVEINSATDNPLIFENGDIITCGNFHGEPLALVLDYAALALAELASISERRTYLLLEGHDGLPRLLMKNTGLNSAFMIPQYTAAALVSENKVLAHPASVDSIPTCLGQEDHVSMGSVSAIKLLQVLRNVEYVLAIELLCAAQALDYREPLRPGRGVEAAHKFIRTLIPHSEADHYFRDELEICRNTIARGSIVAEVERVVGLLV